MKNAGRRFLLFLTAAAAALFVFPSLNGAAPDSTPDLHVAVSTTAPTGLWIASDGRVYIAEYQPGNSLKMWNQLASVYSGMAPDQVLPARTAESVSASTVSPFVAVSRTEDNFVDLYELVGGMLVLRRAIGGNNAADPGNPGADPTAIKANSLAFPRGLRFDSAGNLWIADDHFYRILRIPANRLNAAAPSAFLPDLVLGAADFTTRGSGGFTRVKDIEFDSNGNLYGVSFDDQKLFRFNAPFNANQVSPNAIFDLGSNPVNLAFSGEDLYVSMPVVRKIWCFVGIAARTPGSITPDRILGADSGPLAFGSSFGQQGVEFDADGNLFVCDLDNNRLVTFANDGGDAGGRMLLPWEISLQRPKSNRPVRLVNGRGIRVRGTVEKTNLPKKSSDVLVQVAAIHLTTNGGTLPESLDWKDVSQVFKVNKKQVAKWSAKEVASEISVPSGETFEILVRASSNFAVATTQTNRFPFQVK